MVAEIDGAQQNHNNADCPRRTHRQLWLRLHVGLPKVAQLALPRAGTRPQRPGAGPVLPLCPCGSRTLASYGESGVLVRGGRVSRRSRSQISIHESGLSSEVVSFSPHVSAVHHSPGEGLSRAGPQGGRACPSHKPPASASWPPGAFPVAAAELTQQDSPPERAEAPAGQLVQPPGSMWAAEWIRGGGRGGRDLGAARPSQTLRVTLDPPQSFSGHQLPIFETRTLGPDGAPGTLNVCDSELPGRC